MSLASRPLLAHPVSMGRTAPRTLMATVWLACLLCIACPSADPSHAATDSDAPLGYLELTTQGANIDSKLPLLIVIHGLGETPERITKVFSELEPPTRIIAPRAPVPMGDGGSWYPIEKTPRKTRVMRESAARIANLIAQIEKTRPTAGKAVVTGFSQGGALSFALAAYHSKQIFGAVPIAGYLPPDAPMPQRPALGFPVLAFHGLEDGRVPYRDAERTVARLRNAGAKATLRGFAGVAHGISPEMRSEIYAALRALLTDASR